MLPNLIISSGYNASLSNTNLEFNPFVDFGTEEIDVSQALSSSLSSSAGFNILYLTDLMVFIHLKV